MIRLISIYLHNITFDLTDNELHKIYGKCEDNAKHIFL